MREEMKTVIPMNLQFFAEDTSGKEDTAGAGDGDDGQEDDEQSENEKKFTQKDIDDAVKERLARERRKLKKEQPAKKDDESEDKPADNKADENNQKLTALEEKVLCYDHDIAKEYSKEAIALAKAYVDDDTDMDEALEKVIKKFPMFVKGAKTGNDEEEDETDNKGSWGTRHKGQSKKTDGVEDAFLKRNPGLKID